MASLKRASMEERDEVAKRAAREITAWMERDPRTLDVQNVERDEDYQRIDVDLLWTLWQKGAGPGAGMRTLKVEIKGDTLAHRTGNFFFETRSNSERNTPGCFLYTQADWLFYYLMETRQLYLLPMPTTRNWFIRNYESFGLERSTQTSVHGRRAYTTMGKLVKIQRVLKEVPGVQTVVLPESVRASAPVLAAAMPAPRKGRK